MESASPEHCRELQARIGPDARLDEPMWRHTSFRAGGPASLFVQVRTANALGSLLPLVSASGLPWRILGGATNVLVADGGFRGCILSLDGDRPEIDVLAERAGPEGTEVVARISAGSKLILVARKAAEMGLSGLEWAIGVPGTVGGAAVNNAGAHGSDIASVFEAATAVDADGKTVRLDSARMGYSYRSSAFKSGLCRDLALVSIELRLTRGSREAILEAASRFDATRKERQPPGLSAGSVFKNPQGDHAGRLIDASGLKGLKIGGAQVSTVHGNFFLNAGNATASDLYRLARAVQDGVWDRHRIWLELEVELLGEWPEADLLAVRGPRDRV